MFSKGKKSCREWEPGRLRHGALLLWPSQLERLLGIQGMGPKCKKHFCHWGIHQLEREEGIHDEQNKYYGRLGDNSVARNH